MAGMTLYHTGFQEIKKPDIHLGRRNADLGPGFYLSDDLDFSRRWARERRGETTWINQYELSLEGLRVKRLERGGEWYDCIFNNRTGHGDSLSNYDVVVGPIANDTIYDTWGISTSGLLNREQSLRLLMLGPVYAQTVVKSEKAASRLRFVSSQVISADEIAGYRQAVRREEEAFQEQAAKVFEEILGALGES